VRDPESVAGRACSDHGLGGAAGALDVAPLRVDPQAQSHTDGPWAGAEQRDCAVDAAAHCDRDPVWVPTGLEDRPNRRSERVHGELVAADCRCFEQRQAVERAVESFRLRGNDPVAVDTQPDEPPLPVSRRISNHLNHRATVAKKRGWARVRGPIREKCPTLPVMLAQCEPD
jgi:hypothetical protein